MCVVADIYINIYTCVCFVADNVKGLTAAPELDACFACLSSSRKREGRSFSEKSKYLVRNSIVESHEKIDINDCVIIGKLCNTSRI